jgi:hypothetical protein
MKRTLAGLFAIAALLVGGGTALATPPPLPGTPDDTTIKACADYSVGQHSDGTYSASTGVLMFRVIMADTMCKNVTYSFFVFAGGGPATGTAIFTDVRNGDSSTNIYFVNTTLASPPPANICVYATTVTPNGTVQDRAPNNVGTCYPVPTAGSTGSGGMW